MWTLGNAGMGALQVPVFLTLMVFPNDNNYVSFLYGTNSCPCFLLQRLAKDSNPAIAAAASKTIFELKKQWEIEEGDSWRFMMNPKPAEGEETEEANDDADTN